MLVSRAAAAGCLTYEIGERLPCHFYLEGICFAGGGELAFISFNLLEGN